MKYEWPWGDCGIKPILSKPVLSTLNFYFRSLSEDLYVSINYAMARKSPNVLLERLEEMVRCGRLFSSGFTTPFGRRAAAKQVMKPLLGEIIDGEGQIT